MYLAQDCGYEYFWLVTVARWACIPFSVLCAVVCYAWAGKLYGARSGAVATVLWCFCPNALGHGHLLTPDVGATAVGLCAAYSFWRWLNSPTWARTLVAGLALGLAVLCKATWLVNFAIWPAAWMALRLLGSTRWRERLYDAGKKLATVALLSVWVINAGYAFERVLEPLGRVPFISRTAAGRGVRFVSYATVENRFSRTWLASVPVPLPENFVRGVDVQKADFERGMPSYLRGEHRHGGWWYYYLYAMLVKVPLGVWIILLLAIFLRLSGRSRHAGVGDETFLLLTPLAIIAVVSSQTGFNHHLRYVLPAFPFLFIFASQLARLNPRRHPVLTSIAGLSLCWSVGSSVAVFPHSLSYFNELAGGPENGNRHLANSNVDWGQDLLHLKRWLNAHPEVVDVRIGYDLPMVDPRLAGIAWSPIPEGPSREGGNGGTDQAGPLPGWHVISVNRLHGREGKFQYFNDFVPVDRIGYTMRVYFISESDANRVRTKYGLPPVKTSALPQ
jgi:4-amino-4-deoxy-L-arabinose transferase-like glycosyltransferase